MTSLRIVHEDERVIAVDKPVGRLVIPARGKAEGSPLVDEVSKHLGGKAYVLHRIDRETSGLVLFAKDSSSHTALSKLFEARKIRKYYLALVQGRIDSDGRVQEPLREFGSGRVGIDSKGKASLTKYSVRESFKDASLLEVRPKTGRRHQIRVHLYSIGHPVLGDPLYGKDRPVGGAGRLMLHAWKLEFKGEGFPKTSISTEPPADFTEIVGKFRS